MAEYKLTMIDLVLPKHMQCLPFRKTSTTDAYSAGQLATFLKNGGQGQS